MQAITAHPFLGNSPDRLTWLKKRQKGLGASDVASLYGLGFLDAAELYQSKVADEPIISPMNERMRTGLELEPCIAARYEERTGHQVNLARDVIHSRRNPIAYASLDRVRSDITKPVELKAVFGPAGGSSDWTVDGSGWGPDGGDYIPTRYILQCQWQAGALGSDSVDVAALFVGYEFRVYTIPFNEKLYSAMLEDANEFWEFVRSETPVPADWKPSRIEDVKALGKPTIPGSETILPPESDRYVEQYATASMHLKLYEESMDDAKANLEKMLDTFETGYTPMGSKIARIQVKGGPVSFVKEPSSHIRVYPKKAKKK